MLFQAVVHVRLERGLLGTEFGYWTKYKSKSVAVWLSDTFALHKARKCDTAETRGLY